MKSTWGQFPAASGGKRLGDGNVAVVFQKQGKTNVTGEVGTIVNMTLERIVESACPGEANLARIWRLLPFVFWMKYKVFLSLPPAYFRTGCKK